MSKQPEAKLKKALKEGFEAVFGKYGPDSFWSYVKGTKWGLPDQFFAALDRSAWIESKIDPNGLEKSQELTVPRMARGGAIVWLLQGDTHKGDRKGRVVRLTRIYTPNPPQVFVGWDCFSTLAFWKRIMEVA